MYTDALLNILTPPAGEAPDLSPWLQQGRLSDLLADQRDGAKVLIYGSAHNRHGSILVHGVLVPESDVKHQLRSLRARDSLVEWEGTPYDGPTCGLVYCGDKAWVHYSRPSGFDRNPLYRSAQQLVFRRSFAGRPAGSVETELSQALTHAHDLHWMEERQAWCRLDDSGDIVDLAKIEHFNPNDRDGEATALWIDREILEMHMAATKTCLLLNFDSTIHTSPFHGYDDGDVACFYHDAFGLYMRHLVGETASYFRGTQVLWPRHTAESLGQAILQAKRAPKEYVSFIAQDWRHDTVTDVSCDPAKLASYFDAKHNDAPFQTSLVFFKPEVLDRYRADRDKYDLNDRSLTCRNSWHLKTYDVNEAGQVHTMICYLGNLPYSEQLYWKSFNEAPKGPPSKRSIETDFKGEFSSVHDPLVALKSLLTEFQTRKLPWFRLINLQLVDHLNYPLTISTKLWADALIDLAKAVVESLQHGYLQREALKHGRTMDQKFRSIRWARELLIGLGFEEARAIELMQPLDELQSLRSTFAAHAGGSSAERLRRDLLAKHGTPRAHIADLADRILESFKALDQIFGDHDGAPVVKPSGQEAKAST
jgi:hypothetical protein